MVYDTVVIGLGPAGSTVLYHLAGRGFRVVGIDMARFPRYKSCGGCISVKVGELLDFDISHLIEHTVYGATFTYRCARMMDIISDEVVGYNIMRDRFDHHLLEQARKRGAEVVEGLRVVDVVEKKGYVEVECDEGRTFKGSFLVGADGASGITGRKVFGMDRRRSAVSVTAEVPYRSEDLGMEIDGRLFIDFGSVPYGYGWIFPKERYLSVGIAGDTLKVGGRIKDFFNTLVRGHTLLKGLRIGERVGWTVPTFYGEMPLPVKGRIALVGDTGHLVDPFLGEGIYYAIKTASMASSVIGDAIESGTPDLSTYGEMLKGEIYPEFTSAERLSDLVYNHPRLWYRMIEKEPEIMYRFYDVIRGKESFGVFYRWIWSKVRSKPWKVLRRWLESRFLPA